MVSFYHGGLAVWVSMDVHYGLSTPFQYLPTRSQHLSGTLRQRLLLCHSQVSKYPKPSLLATACIVTGRSLVLLQGDVVSLGDECFQLLQGCICVIMQVK